MTVLVAGFQLIFSFRVDGGDGTDAPVGEAEAGPEGFLEGGGRSVENPPTRWNGCSSVATSSRMACCDQLSVAAFTHVHQY